MLQHVKGEKNVLSLLFIEIFIPNDLDKKWHLDVFYKSWCYNLSASVHGHYSLNTRVSYKGAAKCSSALLYRQKNVGPFLVLFTSSRKEIGVEFEY